MFVVCEKDRRGEKERKGGVEREHTQKLIPPLILLAFQKKAEVVASLVGRFHFHST